METINSNSSPIGGGWKGVPDPSKWTVIINAILTILTALFSSCSVRF